MAAVSSSLAPTTGGFIPIAIDCSTTATASSFTARPTPALPFDELATSNNELVHRQFLPHYSSASRTLTIVGNWKAAVIIAFWLLYLLPVVSAQASATGSPAAIPFNHYTTLSRDSTTTVYPTDTITVGDVEWSSSRSNLQMFSQTAPQTLSRTASQAASQTAVQTKDLHNHPYGWLHRNSSVNSTVTSLSPSTRSMFNGWKIDLALVWLIVLFSSVIAATGDTAVISLINHSPSSGNELLERQFLPHYSSTGRTRAFTGGWKVALIALWLLWLLPLASAQSSTDSSSASPSNEYNTLSMYSTSTVHFTSTVTVQYNESTSSARTSQGAVNLKSQTALQTSSQGDSAALVTSQTTLQTSSPSTSHIIQQTKAVPVGSGPKPTLLVMSTSTADDHASWWWLPMWVGFWLLYPIVGVVSAA